MQTTDLIQILALIFLIFLSGFFSSAETALVSYDRIRMRTLADDGNQRATRVLKITESSGNMLGTILVGNNIANLSASAVATSLALRHWGDLAVSIATGALTLLILILGEVGPKTIATLYADTLALAYSGLIGFLMVILSPIVKLVNGITHLLFLLLGIDSTQKNESYTEDELLTMVDASHEEGLIEPEEHEMIHNVFDFGDAKVRELMIPRNDLTYVYIHDSYQRIFSIFQETGYSRLPVFPEYEDTVLGILNIKDLFLKADPSSFSMEHLLREPYFTYEQKNAAELLMEMRQDRISMAIVLDEYGATAGIITLEDLLEEIVGEIRDEYDSDETDPITSIGPGQFLVSASLNLDDFAQAMELPLSSSDYDSIGGYILGILDHIPQVGESVTLEDGTFFEIKEMDNNRITVLFLQLPISS